MDKIKVLQLICPLGFYGAERWVVALGNNSKPNEVDCHLAVTDEGGSQNLDIVTVYPTDKYNVFRLKMDGSFDLRVILKLVKLIKNEQIDVVHTHGYKSDIIGFIASKLTRRYCISTPHGFGVPSSRKLAYFIKLGKFFLKHMDLVVPLSRQLEREVLAVGVPEKKIRYVQNGVDLTEIDHYVVDRSAHFAQKESSENSEKVVGFVGQMIPRKNIRDLLDVFDVLWREDKSMRLKLLGDGESRAELETYSQSLKSSAAIEFLGFRSDRLEVMQSFDLFAMTSEDEGIPRCLMEAMAMQLPVAAYDISGIDQLITSGETGLLAPFGDKEKLAEHWRLLLNDSHAAETLSVNAREFVLEHFSAARMAEEYAGLYRELLNR